jgi:hypothetical protein
VPERSSRRGPARIALNIDALVLDELPREGRAAVVAAVERALARLVAEHGLPPTRRGDGRIAPPARAESPTETAEQIGERVARAVYAALEHARPAAATGAEGLGLRLQSANSRSPLQGASEPGRTGPTE